jgi:hypothetical protein
MNENADDNFNLGYDAEIIDIQANDIYFQNENYKLVIQGVGFFDVNKSYPLTLKSNQTGVVNFMIDGLENFDPNQPIYIHDNSNNSLYNLKGTTVSLTIPAGEIINRFTLIFSNTTLSSEDNSINTTYVFFNTNEKVVEIANNKNLEIQEATLFSILGQKIKHWEINSNENSIKLPVKNIETGVYIVKIKTNNNTYFTEKIIIK